MTKPPARPRRLRLVVLAGLIALAVAGVMYLRCGSGFGLGGGSGVGLGKGKGEGGAHAPSAVPRCRLRFGRRGLSSEDRPLTVEQAISRCKAAGAADLTITGDAVYGDAEAARRALEAGGIKVFSPGG